MSPLCPTLESRQADELVAHAVVPAEAIWFQGHFPGLPILPGVAMLALVEDVLSRLWPDNAHAAVALPDGRKGEQIVLVTDAAEASRVGMVGWAQNHGVTELALPRRVVLVEAIPILATGKTDYVSVQKMAQGDLES